MVDQKWNVRPLAATWCEAFAEAGFDDQAAQAVLNAIRDSPPEAQADRDQFFRTLARQSVAWYQDTLDGKTLEPTILMEVVEAFKAQQGDG